MIYVGFSGGVDSVVLLHKMKEEFGSDNITAVYVNHHLSPNSTEWERSNAELCKNWGIPFIAKQVTLNGKSEEEARNHRYEAFKECCSEIYLAHHKDDDIETVLFKMIRGCGLSGLKGIERESNRMGLKIHRPLLDMTKDEIIAYAKANNLTWVTDESNMDTSYSRNFLRNTIIPTIKEKFPSFTMSFTRLKENVVEADDLIRELAISDCKDTGMRVDNILQLSQLRRRNMIRHFVRLALGNLPPSNQFNEFVRQIETVANGKQPKMVVGDRVIGISGGKLTRLE